MDLVFNIQRSIKILHLPSQVYMYMIKWVLPVKGSERGNEWLLFSNLVLILKRGKFSEVGLR